MKSKKPTYLIARAVLLAVLFCAATLPQPALGWFAPPPPRLVLQASAAPPRSRVPALRLPLLPFGLAMTFGPNVMGPVYPPRRDPFMPTRRWVGCVNAYNAARLQAKSLVPGPGPAPITLLPRPFGPCGQPPEYESAPIILRRARVLLPLPASARGESR